MLLHSFEVEYSALSYQRNAISSYGGNSFHFLLMAGFAGLSLHLGQEFLFFSTDKFISFTNEAPLCSQYPFKHHLHPDLFLRSGNEGLNLTPLQCFLPTTVFSLSHPPAAIAPSKPHTSWNALPVTNSRPSLLPEAFLPLCLRAPEAITRTPLLPPQGTSLGLVLFAAINNLPARTKVWSWFDPHWLLWNATDIPLLFQLTEQLIKNHQWMICN